MHLICLALRWVNSTQQVTIRPLEGSSPALSFSWEDVMYADFKIALQCMVQHIPNYFQTQACQTEPENPATHLINSTSQSGKSA